MVDLLSDFWVDTLVDEVNASLYPRTTGSDGIQGSDTSRQPLVSIWNIVSCVLNSYCRGCIRAVGHGVGHTRQAIAPLHDQQQPDDVLGGFSTGDPAGRIASEGPVKKNDGGVVHHT